MMNKLKRISIFIIAFMLAFSASACKAKPKSKQQDRVGIHESTVTVDNTLNLFSNGSSEYKIVIPDNATAHENTAANELEYFFRLSTSYSLPIVNESAFSGDKFLSIGKTDKLATSGIKYDDDVLGISGYKTVTKGDDVYFIGSNGGIGCLYSVYEFLHHAVGYRYYASDEYGVESLSTVPLYKFDVTEVPTIQMRNSNDFLTNNDRDLARRLRFNGYGETLYTGVHTELQIMPPAEYQKEHPEWYSNGGLHLCYSQGDDLKQQFIKNIQYDLTQKESAVNVTVGLSDYNSFCGCDDCTATIEKYGTESAAMILFLNDIIPTLDEWVARNYPNRKVEWYVMAYQKTVEAPATKQADGTFKPNGEAVKCHKNLGVIIYDSGVSFSTKLDSDRNNSRLDIVKAWASLSDHIIIGTYATNFTNFFMDFPNYLAIEDNYTIWANNNVVAITEMGNFITKGATFQVLRNYLMSRFMWNSTLNYEETVKEFMQAYYRQGSNAMYEYFVKKATWQQLLADEKDVDHGYLYYHYLAEHWPKNIVDSFNVSIQKAYKAIEPLKDTDLALYEKLFNRIKTEELSVIYKYLSFHQSYFTRDEKIVMLDEFEYYTTKLGVTSETEAGATIFETIATWRAGL